MAFHIVRYNPYALYSSVKDNLQAPSDLFDEVAGPMEGEDITLDSGLFCPSILSLLPLVTSLKKVLYSYINLIEPTYPLTGDLHDITYPRSCRHSQLPSAILSTCLQLHAVQGELLLILQRKRSKSPSDADERKQILLTRLCQMAS